MKHWRTYLFAILFTEAAGALSAFLSRNAAELYTTAIISPPLSPPAAVFPGVWSILYALMGVSAARIYLASPSPDRTRSLRLFLLQLAFNVLWSVFFFRLQWYGFSLLWLLALWILILAMIRSFRRVDPLAAALQIPYLLWVTFAAYLNWGVWRLNP